MIKIPLTMDKIAIIDEADADLSKLKWHAHDNGRIWYARRTIHEGYQQRNVRMHRTIMEKILGRPLTRSETVDHLNNDGLDNRRSNLRVATIQQNSWNQRKKPNTSSRFKGVSWHVSNKKWSAYIRVNGKQKMLGHFLTEEEAARAYDHAAKIHYGDFCALNFKED